MKTPSLFQLAFVGATLMTLTACTPTSEPQPDPSSDGADIASKRVVVDSSVPAAEKKPHEAYLSSPAVKRAFCAAHPVLTNEGADAANEAMDAAAEGAKNITITHLTATKTEYGDMDCSASPAEGSYNPDTAISLGYTASCVEEGGGKRVLFSAVCPGESKPVVYPTWAPQPPLPPASSSNPASVALKPEQAFKF